MTADQLRKLAIAHRRVILAVLLYFLYMPVLLGFKSAGLMAEKGQPAEVGDHITTIYVLAFLVFALFAVYKLAGMLKAEQGIGFLYAGLMFVPVVGLIVLLWMNHRSTKILKKYGVKVGLMGADLKSISEPEVN
ncbi:hypothetical protein [Adhaeretor mobilis]|uniref:hypothetical protein n=1 Tax=Adhaeretor mobilis TaxID=1930276 RepID=UPI00119FE236|nr:hypothetical protein [Adhaeretor mobilis]